MTDGQQMGMMILCAYLILVFLFEICKRPTLYCRCGQKAPATSQTFRREGVTVTTSAWELTCPIHHSEEYIKRKENQ